MSLRGTVKSTFAGTRLSCRDDADFFFAIFSLDGVNYEEERDAAVQADGMPSFLVPNDAIELRFLRPDLIRFHVSYTNPTDRNVTAAH